LKCQIYTRELLESGHRLIGPAVIEQLDTTTVIHPEQEAAVDDYGNLIVKEKK
jgi:N-methylhydantoinase A